MISDLILRSDIAEVLTGSEHLGELLAQRPRGSRAGALLVAGDDGEVLAAGVKLVEGPEGAEGPARDDLGARASDALAAACARGARASNTMSHCIQDAKTSSNTMSPCIQECP